MNPIAIAIISVLGTGLIALFIVQFQGLRDGIARLETALADIDHKFTGEFKALDTKFTGQITAQGQRIDGIYDVLLRIKESGSPVSKSNSTSIPLPRPPSGALIDAKLCLSRGSWLGEAFALTVLVILLRGLPVGLWCLSPSRRLTGRRP